MKTKFITLAVAVFMIVMATTVTAFAATGTWKQDEATQTWTCVDKNGELITEEWVKSGEDWFWLNEDGVMATAQLVEYNDNLYCVDEKGQMISNNWVFVNNEDYDNRWMYFQSTGRCIKSGWKKINGKEYHFTDNCMDYGFLDENAAMIDKDDDEAWKEATYFCGEDGAKRVNEWVQVDDMDAANGKNWIYFGANGKKVVDCKKTINGTTYVFKTSGAIYTSFVDATISSASVAIDSYMDEDGKMLKKGWIYTYLSEDAEDQNWFYAGGNGTLYKDCVKSIDGKKYAFDADGKMLTGFVEVTDENKPATGKAYSAADIEFKDTQDGGLGNKYMYFTESATPSEQGAAVTGKTQIALADFPITVKFSSRGIAETSNGKFVIKDGYAYVNSVLYKLPESDYKYEVIIDENGDFYVLNPLTGKASKKGTFTDSWNDIKYEIKDGVVTVYVKDANGKWVVR